MLFFSAGKIVTYDFTDNQLTEISEAVFGESFDDVDKFYVSGELFHNLLVV